uniref:Midkine n=1 Tax=Mus musculus TaxID=10090 RepID=Q2LEK6_MOUSE|nr:embryonic-specific truncated midkine B [Mus musculus]
MQHRGFFLLALLALLVVTSAVAKKKEKVKKGSECSEWTLKKARYNAQCQETIRVTKPCTSKTKSKTKAKKGKGKD